ncbi:hypothetical protein D3C80_784140 [compost metagenome]
METKNALAHLIQTAPIGAGSFQQHIGADDVGFDESGRSGNGAIDVTLCRQMHHGIWLMHSKHAIQLSTIADIYLLERIAFAIGHIRQGCQIACIGQFIEVDDEILSMTNDMAYHSRADKAGTSGNKNLHINRYSCKASEWRVTRILDTRHTFQCRQSNKYQVVKTRRFLATTLATALELQLPTRCF